MFDVNASESLPGEDLNMNKKAFTLMELMIVVAIVFILAAIAIPNIQRYFAEKLSKPVTNSQGLR